LSSVRDGQSVDDRLDALPEIERENILAGRLEEMQKFKDSMQLDMMYKMAGAGGDDDDDDDDDGPSRKRRKSAVSYLSLDPRGTLVKPCYNQLTARKAHERDEGGVKGDEGLEEQTSSPWRTRSTTGELLDDYALRHVLLHESRMRLTTRPLAGNEDTHPLPTLIQQKMEKSQSMTHIADPTSRHHLPRRRRRRIWTEIKWTWTLPRQTTKNSTRRESHDTRLSI